MDNPLDKHRRAFLIQTVAGVGAVAAGAVPEAQAQTPGSAPAATAAAPAQPVGKGAGVGAFLNIDNAITVEAIAERIMPGAAGKPGARDLGVLNYIDLALAGPYARLQEFYRQGLAQLDAYCNSEFKDGFADLTAEEQDKVLVALQQGKASGFEWPTAKEFFETVRTHTMEGMFADPIYGGNKNYGGWRLVEFPGAQAMFTKDDMETNGPFVREPIVGLQS
jgi:gluconate 2-dehydrogenase gamma chain